MCGATEVQQQSPRDCSGGKHRPREGDIDKGHSFVCKFYRCYHSAVLSFSVDGWSGGGGMLWLDSIVLFTAKIVQIIHTGSTTTATLCFVTKYIHNSNNNAAQLGVYLPTIKDVVIESEIEKTFKSTGR